MVMKNCGFDQSRRTMLKTMAGAGGAVVAGHWAWPDAGVAQTPAVDSRVAGIVANTISVDLHNHVRYPFVRTPADLKPDPEIDFPGALKLSGLSALCYCYCVDTENDGVGRPPQPGDYYKFHIQSLDYADRLLTKTGVRRALTFADVKAAHGRKEPIIIQNSEGAQFVDGRLERIEEAYKRGLRHLQLLHQVHDLTRPMGDIQDQNPTQFNGLTAFGADTIRECNRLGIVVDLAHGHQSTVLGAAKVAQQPLVVSHTALNTPTGRGTVADWLVPRLVSKEHAKAVADTGGVVGVWSLFPTMKAYVTELKEMADTIGIDHVAIGTDSAMAPPPGGNNRGTNNRWPDLSGGFLYGVANEMLAQGFRPADIAKIAGGNYFRVFEKVTARRA